MSEWNLDEIETEDTVSKSELQLLGKNIPSTFGNIEAIGEIPHKEQYPDLPKML